MHPITESAAKAERLRFLHHADEPLVLVNAWDAASARIVESLGFPAIGTSSAGIANSLAIADGEDISREEMLACVARIARAVRVPVTADLEAGYGQSVEAAIATTTALIEAGAVGLNFEDGTDKERGALTDPGLQVERIRAIRRTGDEAGVHVVINARTDACLRGIGARTEQLRDSIERANRYLAAGADCAFVPGVVERDEIEHIVRAIDGPVNVLAKAASPSVSELGAIGVKRISLGSAPMAYAMAMLRDAALEVRDRGTFAFDRKRISYAELNELVSG